MASAPVLSSDFEIGRVISRTFSNISQNWLTLTIVGVAVAAVSMIIGTAMMRGLTDADIQANPFVLFQSSGYWITIVGGMALNAFALSAILSTLLGKRGGDISEALAGGLRFLLPMLVLVTLWTVGFVIGLTLLIVPGVILATMWSASAPTLIAENSGVFAAFSRSRSLTSGLRWKVFGALIVFSLIFYIIVFAIQNIGGGSLALYSGNPVGFVIGTIASAISTLAMPSFLAALYVELVGAKGNTSSELADVFS